MRFSASGPFEVIDTTGSRVGHLKKAIIAKFKHRFAGVDPDQLQVFKLDGGSHILLNSAQTLHEAGIHAGTELVVEVTAAAQAAVTALPGARGEMQR